MDQAIKKRNVPLPALKDEVIEQGASKWLVKYATDLKAAMYAINLAACSGSIGNTYEDFNNGVLTRSAKVVRLDKDGKPCTPS